MDRRLRCTITFAFAAHLLAAWGFWLVPVIRLRESAPAHLEPIEVWSGVEEAVGQENSVSSVVTPSSLRPVLVPRAVHPSSGIGIEGEAAVGGDETGGHRESSAPVVLFQSAPATAMTMAIAGKAPNPFVERSPEAPAKPVLTDGPHGTEGPVLTALQDATLGSLAPNRGYATFRAVIDETGTVVDLRVVAVSGDERGWNDARDRALQALKGKKVGLRRKCEMDVLVTSDVKLPSGNTLGKPITPKFEESYIPSSPNAPGSMAPAVAARTLAEFDLTDIGAKARRVVHTRLVSFVPL